MFNRKVAIAIATVAMGLAASATIGWAAPEIGKSLSRASGAGAPVTARTAVRAQPQAASGKILQARRLNESRYRNMIADVFGPEIVVAGRFVPSTRVGGLLASSDAVLSISPAGFDGFSKMADAIADQVLAEPNRGKYLNCVPQSPTTPDNQCARLFLSRYGELLFRRPLAADQLEPRVALASRIATSTGSFHEGLRFALTSLLTAPEFLYDIERAVPGGSSPDGYSRAARMSALLWNSGPDAELLRAAKAGGLGTVAGRQAQADRLMASPRFQRGMMAFFNDMLRLDQVAYVSKDARIYPKYNDDISRSAAEETRRMVLGLLFNESGDYRDLLTTRKTYLNRSLAVIYGIPFSFEGEWTPYEFPESSGRSGILTQVTFLSTFSHPGRSSPTLRGVALREAFMCERTPDPPANVDFSLVNGTAGESPLKTLRERLLAHASDDSCASCHTRTDPIGLALEHFDGVGAYRALDNGEPIDASAQIGKKSFVGAQGLAYVLRDDPKIPTCLVQNLYAYTSGANGEELDRDLLQPALKLFADGGYKVAPLIRHIATSEDTYRVVSHPPPAPGDEVLTEVAQR